MNTKHFSDVLPFEVKKEGFNGMFARYLWSTDDGCTNFAMAYDGIQPGGHTSYHSHAEEHEFYCLEGEPAYIDEGVAIDVAIAPHPVKQSEYWNAP